MKKYISLSLILVMSFLIGGLKVNAEEATTTSSNSGTSYGSIQERKEAIKAERERIMSQREESKEKIEKLKESLRMESDQAKAKLKNDRLTNRQNVLKRFDQILNIVEINTQRVNNLITKAEGLKIDTTKAKDNLLAVETKLKTAETKTSEISALLAISTNEITAEQKAKLQTLKKDFQNSIKEAHELLKNTVKDLKGEVKSKTPEKVQDFARPMEDN